VRSTTECQHVFVIVSPTRSSRCSSHQELTSSATSSPDSPSLLEASPPPPRDLPACAAASAASSAGPSVLAENWNSEKQPMHSSSLPSPYGEAHESTSGVVLCACSHCHERQAVPGCEVSLS